MRAAHLSKAGATPQSASGLESTSQGRERGSPGAPDVAATPALLMARDPVALAAQGQQRVCR
jgi:hypothetical protein